MRRIIDQVRTYIEAEECSGYDPFDALKSPLLQVLTRRSRWGKIAAMQALRRCPVNVRPLLGIRKGHNPKALGLFLGGYARLYALEGEDRHLKKIGYLLDLLDSLKSEGYSGNRRA